MASRHSELMGKHVLVTFKTTHIDRAGETGSQISKLGEIVDVDAAGSSPSRRMGNTSAAPYPSSTGRRPRGWPWGLGSDQSSWTTLRRRN
jgi:hypothetical protein